MVASSRPRVADAVHRDVSGRAAAPLGTRARETRPTSSDARARWPHPPCSFASVIEPGTAVQTPVPRRPRPRYPRTSSSRTFYGSTGSSSWTTRAARRRGGPRRASPCIRARHASVVDRRRPAGAVTLLTMHSLARLAQVSRSRASSVAPRPAERRRCCSRARSRSPWARRWRTLARAGPCLVLGAAVCGQEPYEAYQHCVLCLRVELPRRRDVIERALPGPEAVGRALCGCRTLAGIGMPLVTPSTKWNALRARANIETR